MALDGIRKIQLFPVLVFWFTLLLASPGMAQNIFVNTLAGDNDGSCDAGGTGPGDDCSLLEAIDVANANPDAAHIEFSVSGTITPDDDPVVLTPVTLDGTTAPGGTRSVTINRDVEQLGFEIGLQIRGAAAAGSVVQGLAFGRTLLGAIGNSMGVQVEDAANVRLGGSVPAEGNRFTEHDYSIQYSGAGAGNGVIRGNTITGNNQGEYDYAISVGDAPNAVIGGTGPNDGNTIEQVEFAIFITGAGSSGFSVVGNTLTDISEDGIRLVSGMSGGSVVANTLNRIGEGIVTEAMVSGLVLGGLAPGEGNVILGGNPGIRIGSQSSNIDVLGNQITTTGSFGIRVQGTTSDNVEILGNQVSGPFIGIAIDGAPDAIVGGTGAGEGNIISDTEFAGIRLQFPFAERARVSGNTITGDSETGIYVDDAIDSLIGGTGSGEGNVISGAETGIFIFGNASNNAALGNLIMDASVLGIDLTASYPGDGVTLNDPAPDADSGANGLVNFPVITAVNPGVDIEFSLASLPATTFRVEAFASAQQGPAGFGPGERFLGSVQVTTDGAGNANGTAPAVGLLASEWATLTATVVDGTSPTGFGGTSEFSAAARAGGALPAATLSLSPALIAENGGTTTITVTLSAAASGNVVVTLGYSGEAQRGVDFTAPTTLTILDGQTTATGTITALDNNDDNPAKNFSVSIASVSANATVSPVASDQPVTIQDDDNVAGPQGGAQPVPALPWPALALLAVALLAMGGRVQRVK